jgi:hypothetical protein
MEFLWSGEVLENAARAVFDVLHGAGAWDNPGSLPDEIDRDLYRAAAAAALDSLETERVEALGGDAGGLGRLA